MFPPFKLSLFGLSSRIKLKRKRRGSPNLLKIGRAALFVSACCVINVSHAVLDDKSALSKLSPSDLYEIPKKNHPFDGKETSGFFLLIESEREKCGIFQRSREMSDRRSLTQRRFSERRALSFRDRQKQAQNTLTDEGLKQQPVQVKAHGLISRILSFPDFADFAEEVFFSEDALEQDFAPAEIFLSRPPLLSSGEAPLYQPPLKICSDETFKTVFSSEAGVRGMYAGLPSVAIATALIYVAVCLFNYSTDNKQLTVACKPFWKILAP